MNYSITYIVFSSLAIAVITGLVIIIRNSIKITSTYKFFKRKLKVNKSIQLDNISSVTVIEVEQNANLIQA